MTTTRRIFLAGLAFGIVALAGGVANATHTVSHTPTNTKFFMRNDGGATCPGDPFLSVTPGQAEPGCGYQGGIPAGELYHAGVLASTIRTYTSRDGVPVVLDAARDATGNVRVVSTSQTNRMAVGQVRVDVTVRGISKSGSEVVLGKASSEKIINPTNSAEIDFPFTINVPDSLDKTQLNELTVDVDIRGWHILSGYHRLNGFSWVDLATFKVEPIPD